MKPNYQMLFLALICMNAISYYFARGVLFSIAWLDRGGKYNKTKRLFSTVSFYNRLSMKFLSPYVINHQKEFQFWFFVKRLLVIIETPLMLLYIGIAFLKMVSEDTCAQICTLLLLQAGIITTIMCCQYDINRNTKYDRMRIRKQ